MISIVWIVAAAAGVLLLAFLVSGLLLKPLNKDARAQLTADGEAHQFADLGSGTVHYRLEGPVDAPLIVLVHGYSTPSFVFDDYFAPLKVAGFRILTFDLYGRGFSDRPPGSYGVMRYVDQLESLLNHIGATEPVHLVGYSMGGPIATQFSNSHRPRVASVSLIAPAGLARPEGQGSSLMFRPLIGEWFFRVLGSSVLRKRFADGFEYAPDPVTFEANFGAQFSYRGLDHALLDTVRAFGRGEFNVDYAAACQAGVPVQAFFSENDRVIPIVSADCLATKNPLAKIHRFPDGDHAIGYGKAHEITARIADFAGR